MIVFSLSILILFMVVAAPVFIYHAVFDILGLLEFMDRLIKFFFIVWLIGLAYYFIVFIVERIQVYGYLDNKKINKNNTPYFKDVPCNDVFYAASLIGINTCNYNRMNIIGAVLLYWIKNNKVRVIKNNNEIFLQFIAPLPFEGRQFESELYEMFISMSQDGILREYEYKKWVRGVNYKRYAQFEKEAKYVGKKELFDKKLIWKKGKENCKKYYVMADVLYEDYRKIYGLNLFLQNKENYNLNTMNIDLWLDYVMFACLFGNSRKVIENLKNIPIDNNVLMQNNIDLNVLEYINNISLKCHYFAKYNAGLPHK